MASQVVIAIKVQQAEAEYAKAHSALMARAGIDSIWGADDATYDEPMLVLYRHLADLTRAVDALTKKGK